LPVGGGLFDTKIVDSSLFPVLITTKLECTLESISEESRPDTSQKCPSALVPDNLAKGRDHSLEQMGETASADVFGETRDEHLKNKDSCLNTQRKFAVRRKAEANCDARLQDFDAGRRDED
jgi:hypothetical protein